MEIQSWWMIKCRMDDCASSKNITAEPSKGCRLERCPSRIHPHNHSCRTIGALFHNFSHQRGVGQYDALRFCRYSVIFSFRHYRITYTHNNPSASRISRMPRGTPTQHPGRTEDCSFDLVYRYKGSPRSFVVCNRQGCRSRSH